VRRKTIRIPRHRYVRRVDETIVKEALEDSAKATGGDVSTFYTDAIDDRNIWSNGQALYGGPDEKDAELTLQLLQAGRGSD
jgi:hypothetical protein